MQIVCKLIQICTQLMDIVHTSIMLDTRRILKDGTYPVKLRLTFMRQRKYYLTPHSLTELEFANTKAEKPKGKFKELSTAFNAIEQKAINVIKDLPAFSFESFEKKYLSNHTTNDVFSALTSQQEAMTSEGRAGSANTYKDTFISLLSFVLKIPVTRNKGIPLKEAQAKREALLNKQKHLPFSKLTPEFLKEYEKWMVSNGKSLTTIGIYARNLRTVFNNAISLGEVQADIYPFGKRKYQIPAGRNVKKALVLSDIEKLFTYEPKQDSEARARDLFLFSYLCNGINIKDIARLKYKQLQPEQIRFVRAKTERTTRGNLKTIAATRTQEVNNIIERWGNKPALQDSYVFPILTPGLTPEQELSTVRQATKRINHYIKRIAAAVGIEKNISSYTARHSYATVMKRSGAPMEFISEALGHADLRTTESYLDSFEDKIKKEFASHLTAFKKK